MMTREEKHRRLTAIARALAPDAAILAEAARLAGLPRWMDDAGGHHAVPFPMGTQPWRSPMKSRVWEPVRVQAAVSDGAACIAGWDKAGDVEAMSLTDSMVVTVITTLLQAIYLNRAPVPMPLGVVGDLEGCIPVHSLALGLADGDRPILGLQIGPIRLDILLEPEGLAALATESAKLQILIDASQEKGPHH